jgi:hypothetical protein
MSTLIRFLEVAGTVWRVIVFVVACLAGLTFYQYKNHQANLWTDDVSTVVDSARTKTNFGFVSAAFDSIDRFFGFTDRKSGGSTHVVVNDEGGGSGTTSTRSSAAAPASRPQTPVRGQTTATGPSGPAERRTVGFGFTSIPPTGSVASEIDRSNDVKVSDEDVREAFRRFASQFCRATRAIASYYSDRISGPNGLTRVRVGSGVQFPSLDRLTDGAERPLAEKELEVRLRCDYELAYGAGERADPKRPAFEQWRQATLERQYGGMWTRIDLSHIPTPDDPKSRGEWYVLAETSQE